MKTLSAAIVIMAFLLTTAVFAQHGHQRGGQGGGPRMGAPAAQSAPAQRGPGGPGMGQGMRQGPPPQGARQAPPQSYDRGHAQPRPMPPAYNQGHRGYGPPVYRPGYGYRPHGYYPYGGYAAPYGYGYAYPYYPSVGLSVGPGGWALGGVYGGISVYYERQTVEQSSAQVEEVQGPASPPRAARFPRLSYPSP